MKDWLTSNTENREIPWWERMVSHAALWFLLVPVLWFLIILVLSSLVWWVGEAKADHPITACSNNIVIENVNILEEGISETGHWVRKFDRNKDGMRDLVAFYHIKGIDKKAGQEPVYQIEHYAFMYIADLDYDGQPDKVYVDKYGEGKCDDIVEYMDLHAPKQEPFKEHNIGVRT